MPRVVPTLVVTDVERRLEGRSEPRPSELPAPTSRTIAMDGTKNIVVTAGVDVTDAAQGLLSSLLRT